MNSHISIGTKREVAEQKLLAKFPCMKIFEPDKHAPDMLQFQDGSFGFGYAASALYAHGFNQRGISKFAPFGLLYHENKVMFGLGYFRKDGTNDDGYLMLLAPKGLDAVRRVTEIVIEILSDNSIQCSGVYVRFLDEYSRTQYVNTGFSTVTAETNPWHPNAPLEDETFCHSILWLPSVIRLTTARDEGFEVLDLDGVENKEHRRKSRMAFQRFSNFLGRNKLNYRMDRIPFDTNPEPAIDIGRKIVYTHFKTLVNPVGSCAEDYLGLISPDILRWMNTIGYIGYLNDVPISVFLGAPVHGHHTDEKQRTLGLYASITLRNAELVLGNLGIDPYETMQSDSGKPVPRAEGFSAISLFNQMHYFAKVLADGIPIIKLGGSEEKRLDDAKRQMGAGEDKTYWVYKGK